jgi:hypothetical protein
LGNIYFSLPPAQFPITLAPGEERLLQVCFSPLQAREYRDTLRLERFCTNETLLLTGAGNPISRIETTRCNVEVQLTTSAAPLDFFTQQNFPNPASDLTTILIGLPTQAHTTVKLYNALGNYVATLVNGVLPAGIVEVQVDASRLEPGVYVYEVQTPSRRTVHRLTVLR